MHVQNDFYLLSSDAIIKYVNSCQNVVLYNDQLFLTFVYISISTSSCQSASSFSQYSVLSVLSHVSCHFVFVIFTGVVEPSPFNLLP